MSPEAGASPQITPNSSRVWTFARAEISFRPEQIRVKCDQFLSGRILQKLVTQLSGYVIMWQFNLVKTGSTAVMETALSDENWRTLPKIKIGNAVRVTRSSRICPNSVTRCISYKNALSGALDALGRERGARARAQHDSPGLFLERAAACHVFPQRSVHSADDAHRTEV